MQRLNLKKILSELQRRNVIQAAISYAVFSWVLIQVASILYPSFGWGQDAISKTLMVLIIGFPVWIIFAYVFEWTPSGFKKTDNVAQETSVSRATRKKMTGVIIAGMALAIMLLVADRFFDFAATTESTSIDKSIAVLAFADMSPDKDQEYFSDGISEEILNLLAKIPELKVISRTSSFSYKGKEQNVKKIGEELQVANVLEGSIRKSGNTFRITTQLINVADGMPLWSETYDRNMEDIFKIQDEISVKVAQQLSVTILGDLYETKGANPDAYNLYLLANEVGRQRTDEKNEKTEKLLRQSIAIDSTYAPAWVSLGSIVYASAFSFFRRTIPEANKVGKAAINRAIVLDDQNARAYISMAYYNQNDWDFESAERNINKAIALAPNNSGIMEKAAGIFISYGKIDEAIAMLKKAITIDPLNYAYYFNLSLYQIWNGQNDEAEASIKKFMLMYPDAGFAHSVKASILLADGKYEQALVEAEKHNDPFWGLYRKSIVIHALGREEEANKLLQQLVDEYGNKSWPNIAHVYAFRGEKDEAFKWLELALDHKDSSLLEILNYPHLKSLYGDPRWNAFIDKLGLPKDHGFHMD